jgi:tyrosine-protein kinase Etk/Wzc
MVLSIIVLSVAGAYAITRMTTPVYRASTTLYFAEHQSSIPALDLLNQIENGNSEVATEMEVMRSRALAENIVDSLGLQATVTEPRGAINERFFRVMHADPDAPVGRFTFTKGADGAFDVEDSELHTKVGSAVAGTPFSFGHVTIALAAPIDQSRFEVSVRSRPLAVDALLNKLTVTRPNPTASVVQIAYTGHDPLRTKNVPAVLAHTYLTWRSTLRKAGDRSTVEFLREQIDTISGQLYSAENALQRFREANHVADLPTQAQTEVQRLASLEAQRADLDIQRTSLRNLMREVKSAPADPTLGSPYRRLMAFPGLMNNANPAFSLMQSLTDLEQRRTELLVRRTPNDPDVQALTRAIGNIETQIGGVVDTYLSGLDAQSASLTSGIAQFHVSVDQVPRKEVEFARLDRTADGLTQIYTMLQTRLREAQIAEAVDDGAVRVVDPSAYPVRPIAPRLPLNLILGAFLGSILALTVVFLRERLDHTVHTKEDAESIAGSAVLAMIPHIGEKARLGRVARWVPVKRNRKMIANGGPALNGKDPSRLVLKDPQSVAAEAFRKLRTNISFARPDAPPRVMVFTSPAPGDGKSTSVMNLAVALVQQGKKVIVIDGDMRRGGLHTMLNGRQTPGLSEMLVGQADFDAACQSLAMEPFGTVDLLATGVVPPNPAELLASPRFRELIEILRPSYDAVLIDSPPVNLVTDAAIIGRETDGAILVARAAKTTRGELSHAASQLRQIQVPITGLVLNDYNAKRDASYNAPYYYGYSDYRPYAGRT